MTTAAPAPLAGITVLDLTNVLAGPYCCHQLALLGARVIKVEAVGRGDLARNLGADPELNEAGMGLSFLAQNAGKQSITLNLKSPDGKAIFHRLVARAQVLVENFRPGVMARLELSYDSLQAVNENLVYCAISGFGQDGPWVSRPAYDQIIQGVAGVMSVTGDAESAPLRVGYPVADTVGGLTAAFAITSALNASPRGTYIDVSMMESVLSTMGWVVSNHLNGGVDPRPQGNENITSAPSGSFRTADGMINISANKDEQWDSLCRLLDREDLAQAAAYASRELRKANRHQLRTELETTLRTRSSDEWVAALNADGIPAGPILSVPDALATPQVAEREFLQTFDDVQGVDRQVSVITGGMRLDGERPRFAAPPPPLGQDTESLLLELGYGEAEIADFRDRGVV